MTLRNDLIQSAIIAYLKTKTTILAELPYDEEIREDQWQGREFHYPNIRVRLTSLIPQGSQDCNLAVINLSILVYSEKSSSYEADEIAGIISSVLHATQFTHQSINFGLWTTNIIPAIRSEINVWRSEVLMNGIVSG